MAVSFAKIYHIKVNNPLLLTHYGWYLLVMMLRKLDGRTADQEQS